MENQFVRGWTESATLVENNVGPFVEHRVKDSSRFNIAMGYKGIKNLNVRFGIKNITAEEPPFTAVSSYGSHAAGYAASFSDPRGRFLYGSNRGHDSIAIYSIDQATGRLTALGHESTRGQIPRNFEISPDGAFLAAANQDSNSVMMFRIDRDTGLLTPTGNVVEVGTPICVRFI